MKKLIYCFFLIILLAAVAPAAEAATSTTKDACLDSDDDNLCDDLELKFGTDPSNPDTDGDGYADGLEVYNAYSPTSTEPIRLQKLIYINLKTQRLEQRVMNVPLASFVISSGMKGMATPTGNFTVLKKHPRAWSRAAKLWMPYWMLFSWRGQAIHELPEWPGGKKEGAKSLGKPVSHGCVRLGIGPAKTLYDWAPVGTPIKIVSK